MAIFPLGMTVDPIRDHWMVALLEGACLLRAVEFEASWGRGPGAEGHWTRNAVNYFSGSRWVSSIEPLSTMSTIRWVA